MSENKIEASTITKPIQLLAAWLIGLVLVNSSFLTAASVIDQPIWATGVLVVAAVINVPVFLVSLFVLQTKFRPEMQADEFYAKYLHSRYSAETGTKEIIIDESFKKVETIEQQHATSTLTFSGSTKVMINDMLKNYADVRGALQKANIKIDKIFGSTAKEPEVPPFLLLTIGNHADLSLLKRVVETLRGKIEYVSLTPDSVNANTIYVGSYGYRESNRFINKTKLTSEIEKKILSPDLTWEKLQEFLLPL